MILILGVTASGKGTLAFDLAESLDAEIISIDSMKVYRRMDIGTAKPSQEARSRIKHHLIDIVEPSDSFSVSAFLDAATDAAEQIRDRNKTVMAVGGTALYIKALLYGLFEGPGTNQQIRSRLKEQADAQDPDRLHRRLKEIDPEAAARIHPNDAKRIIRALEVYEIAGKPISTFQQQWVENRGQKTEDTGAACGGFARAYRESSIRDRASKHSWTIIGLRRQKDQEGKRINARVKTMIAAGLVDEVRALLAKDKPLSQQARCAIGYAEIIDHLAGRIDLDDAVELIKKNTRRLAKSQRTWFKTFKNVNWLDIEPEEPPEQILSRSKAFIKTIPPH
ncbi:MAG TPA: tRNA (adenosine(37)-N6)-dimethylallyltransferase MiaA [Sedimentisphaerales bacterium]|nr:tRNA (adenosine(37)-N6)-dimethylallyltransferase MiaA [Sedimentisphaerales bacterium]